MRLAAQAKMGYYPTPDRATKMIMRYLKRERQGLIRIQSCFTLDKLTYFDKDTNIKQ